VVNLTETSVLARGTWPNIPEDAILYVDKFVRSRRMWAGKVARMWARRNVERFLVGKSKGKLPLVRPGSRWLNNIKIDILEIRWWRKLHNEELHNLYSSPSIIRIIKSRRMRWAGHVARMGVKRNVYKLLVGKPEGKRPLGRPRRRWMDKFKKDLLEIGVNVVDWIGLAQDRYRWRALVNSVMNLRVP
jgi:hypothetical protein